MPGRRGFHPSDATEMLHTLATLDAEVEELRAKLDGGDESAALDRALRGLQELASVMEPIVQDYCIRHR